MLTACSCLQEKEEDGGLKYGFGYDCPLRKGTFEYCRNIAGGSLTAASLLCQGKYHVAVHWMGGWHHAHKDRASGYCYVNDIVLSILRLSHNFKRVLYIDVDVHHGDGVERAFAATDRILTFSAHHATPGFFPGTGNVEDVGVGRGKFYSVNLPLKEGASDGVYKAIVKKALLVVREKFRPDAVVFQAGCDGLNGDPMKVLNLTPNSLISVLKFVLKWEIPTLVLGGGGYHEANAAKCWCRMTAAVADVELEGEIPEHEYFAEYGPAFEFEHEESGRKDLNTFAYLEETIAKIKNNLSNIQK